MKHLAKAWKRSAKRWKSMFECELNERVRLQSKIEWLREIISFMGGRFSDMCPSDIGGMKDQHIGDDCTDSEVWKKRTPEARSDNCEKCWNKALIKNECKLQGGGE